MGTKMWRVTWAVSLAGDTPQAAAEAAVRLLARPDGLMALHVRQHDMGEGVTIEIDRAAPAGP